MRAHLSRAQASTQRKRCCVALRVSLIDESLCCRCVFVNNNMGEKEYFLIVRYFRETLTVSWLNGALQSNLYRTLNTERMADDRDEAVVFTSSSKNSDDDDNNNNNNNNNEDGDEDGTTMEPRFANTESLGPGPNRFAAEGERPISEQIASLSAEERQCFDNLRIRWKALHPDRPYSDEMYLRFARCSPGKTKFNEKTAWRVMNRFDRRYLVLTASRLESQLLSKTLFPVPGLTTKEGHDVFYMRASRYFPRQTSTKAIIDNLAYCMTTMVEKEKNCAEGIAFLSYMTDWKMQNFAPDYFIQFLRTLQGRVPVRVRLFLIVNPPKFFDRVWMIIKPLLAKEFQNKVRMIPEEALGDYLMDNYTEYLPDDMATGTQPSDVMVHDFVTYRKHVENKHQLVGLKHQQKQMKQQQQPPPPPQDGQK